MAVFGSVWLCSLRLGTDKIRLVRFSNVRLGLVRLGCFKIISSTKAIVNLVRQGS